jgi:hypothetical protein
MYLFTFRARLKPKSETAKRLHDVGGAYVNCWISFKDFEAAEKLAKLLIKDSDWIPEIKTVEFLFRKKGCKNKKERQYYAEALKFGYTLVFHLWPKDAEDSDHNYEAQENSD